MLENWALVVSLGIGWGIGHWLWHWALVVALGIGGGIGHWLWHWLWHWAVVVALGSGCGTVGRAVASDTRDPRFESSHWQILFTINSSQKLF